MMRVCWCQDVGHVSKVPENEHDAIVLNQVRFAIRGVSL
jgi:hypothetical protein